MRSFEPKMKKYWFDILIYGLSLGLLLTAIQFFQYKLVFLHGAFDWYAAVIAIVFCTLGIWAGYQLTQKKHESSRILDWSRIRDFLLTKRNLL